MKEKQSTNFLIGFILGAFICAVVWYWQKSTAADEGALDLLDRMAELDRKLRQPDVAKSPQPAIPLPQPDDLQRVKGIGPVFDGRLRENGIQSINQLAALSAEKLANWLEIGENRAADILAEASQLSQE